MRVEPVFRQRRAAFALDLYLADEHGSTVVPLILVDPAVVVDRDRDALIFPRETPFDDAVAQELEARIVPHLEALVLGTTSPDEHVVTFAPAPHFEAARAAGCFGAAPLRETLARLAPYQYARRFARGRTVAIDAPDAVGGWALLRNIANVGIAERRRDTAAVAWYGNPSRAPEAAAIAICAADVALPSARCVIRVDAGSADAMAIVDPVPLDVAMSFDPLEGPARRFFVVERAPEPVPRGLPEFAYVGAGGNAGRVAVLLGRADATACPGSDVDEARALVDGLCSEGFDAELVNDAGAIAGADLVHLFGTRDGRRARTIVEAARRSAIPIALHAHEEAPENGGWWGATVHRLCFEYGSDERDTTDYLSMLARRAVSMDAARADVPFAPDDAGLEDVTAALRDATIVFAATDVEAERIRVKSHRKGPMAIVPPLAFRCAAAPVGALIGADPFILAHAPIGPIGNQLMVARAAATAEIPLVIAGPVVDASYLERIREFGGPRLVILGGEPEPAVAAGLRAAAAVVVDAAWIGEGASRLAASVLSGARVAVSEQRAFSPIGVELHRFDPASIDQLIRALGAAWDEAQRRHGGPDPETVAAIAPAVALRGIIRGYAAVAAGVPA
jgi:hypothetical protein